MEIPNIHCNVCHGKITVMADEIDKSLSLLGVTVDMDRIEATKKVVTGRPFIHLCDDCCGLLKIVLLEQPRRIAS